MLSASVMTWAVYLLHIEMDAQHQQLASVPIAVLVCKLDDMVCKDCLLSWAG